MVVDADNIGIESISREIENTRYANHCINPTVMDVQTVDVDWSDNHPLNKQLTHREEYERLFK